MSYNQSAYNSVPYNAQSINSLSGSVTASIGVASGMNLQQKHSIVGNIPVTLSVNAVTRFSHHYLTGNVPLEFFVQATIRKVHRAVVGNILATLSVASTMVKYHREMIIGSAPVSLSVNATLQKYHRSIIAGNIPLTFSVAASILEKKSTLVITGGSFQTNLNANIIDTSLYVFGGSFISSLDSNFGFSVTGGKFNSALTAALSETSYLFISGGSFSSSLSCAITSTASFQVSGGSFRNALSSSFGFDIEGGSFASSITAAIEGPSTFEITGGSFNTIIDIAIQDIGVLAVTGGSFNSELLYFSVAGGGFQSSLSASITNTINNSVAYVLNIHTGESTRYTNFPFLHVIAIGGQFYGVKNDGFYLLEGADDDGAVINGSITTKETDFGSFHSKRMAYAYLNSDTKTKITPFVDGVQKTHVDSSFGGHKTKMAKGNSGRYWKFKIENIVKLEGLELLPQERQRRIK
jgi:hypothetical protein